MYKVIAVVQIIVMCGVVNFLLLLCTFIYCLCYFIVNTDFLNLLTVVPEIVLFSGKL